MTRNKGDPEFKWCPSATKGSGWPSHPLRGSRHVKEWPGRQVASVASHKWQTHPWSELEICHWWPQILMSHSGYTGERWPVLPATKVNIGQIFEEYCSEVVADYLPAWSTHLCKHNSFSNWECRGEVQPQAYGYWKGGKNCLFSLILTHKCPVPSGCPESGKGEVGWGDVKGKEAGSAPAPHTVSILLDAVGQDQGEYHFFRTS